MTITFVKATNGDKEYLLKLRKLTMGEHLRNAGLNLTDQEHLMRINEKFDRFQRILSDNLCIGAIKYRLSNKTLEILQFQIHPDFQNLGFGTKVLNSLLSLQQFRSIELSVLKENPAKNLYLNFGFEIIGEDKLEYCMRLNEPIPK